MARDPHVTMQRVATGLNKSPQYVRHLVHTGKLPAERATRRARSTLLVSSADLDVFLASLFVSIEKEE